MSLKSDSSVSRIQLTSAGVPYEWVNARFGGRAVLPASTLAKDAHPALANLLRRKGYEGEIEELNAETAQDGRHIGVVSTTGLSRELKFVVENPSYDGLARVSITCEWIAMSEFQRGSDVTES